jgi:hypothetical protein
MFYKMSGNIASLEEVLNGSNNVGSLPGLGLVENAFDSVGMMRGSAAPVLRAATGFTLATMVMFALRPSFAFDEQGQVRPWKYDPGHGDNEDSTTVSWYVSTLAIVH